MAEHDPSSPSSLAAAALATSAAIFIATVPLLQMDAVSRFLLSPARLRAKRRSEQTYRFRKALDVKTAELRSYVQGNEPRAFKYNPKEEELGTDLLTKEEEYDVLVKEIMGKTKKTPVIVAIDQDPNDERSTREWYLWLAFPPDEKEEDEGGEKKAKKNKWRRVQVPLIPLTQKLADKFEDALSSTALCFVADASGGLGSEIVGRTAAGCGAGAALIREPAWISSFASLVASNVLSKSKMERALFALCRLDAWRVRDSVGECRTVVFTLPGQSCSPALIPLLQKAFPHERHVFAYDSCAEAIRRGIALRRGGKRGPAMEGGTGEAGVFAEVAIMPQAVTATAPLSPLRTVSKIADVLAALPADHADTAEAWMASVDRLLSMKADEAENGYLPFVCRMGFLMGRAGQLGNGAVDVSELALTNVLQYVTGTRSRPPKAEVLDAAREVLRAVREECEALVADVKLTEAEFKAVEECAFEHKGILIQDKTLLDTVQPQKEWSLKAAKKLTGCACCAPEEEDEDEEEAAGSAGPSKAKGIDMSVPGAFAMGLNQRAGTSGPSTGRSNYVDGKTTFAFDPTKFS